MSLVAHISDLHFGSLAPGAPAALLRALDRLSPSLVIISGDITQRACKGQFAAARRFLDAMRWPYLILPGNHDLPLHRPVLRLAGGLRGYHRYITNKDAPLLVNGEMAVVCLDSTAPWRWKGGGVTSKRLERLRQQLGGLPAGVPRLLVAHHPAFPREGERMQGWQAKVSALAHEHQVDLALSGHFHHTVIRPWGEHHELLVMEAGTATSNRLRGEPNAFNALTLSPGRVDVSVYHLTQGVFAPAEGRSFARQDGAWLQQGPLPVAPRVSPAKPHAD